jgi:amidase
MQNIKADDCCHLDTGPELYKDAPIGVQVVGYRQLDEALMNTASVLDSIINGRR